LSYRKVNIYNAKYDNCIVSNLDVERDELARGSRYNQQARTVGMADIPYNPAKHP
jgi:hypothetical protein